MIPDIPEDGGAALALELLRESDILRNSPDTFLILHNTQKDRSKLLCVVFEEAIELMQLRKATSKRDHKKRPSGRSILNPSAQLNSEEQLLSHPATFERQQPQ
jgi:hypothetical protein